jgi:DNA-binding transcriptional ArsR family regulator
LNDHRSRAEHVGAPGDFSYDGLDRVVHEKARLGILTALVAHTSGRTFVELKSLCALTDGNLARHLQVLQDAGIVRVRKEREGGRAVTIVALTKTGRRQFVAYLEELERVIRDARVPETGADEAGLAPA